MVTFRLSMITLIGGSLLGVATLVTAQSTRPQANRLPATTQADPAWQPRTLPELDQLVQRDVAIVQREFRANLAPIHQRRVDTLERLLDNAWTRRDSALVREIEQRLEAARRGGVEQLATLAGPRRVALIVDASGSMTATPAVERQQRIVRERLATLDSTSSLALLGHDPRDPAAATPLEPLTDAVRSRTLATVDGLSLRGSPDVAATLLAAFRLRPDEVWFCTDGWQMNDDAKRLLDAIQRERTRNPTLRVSFFLLNPQHHRPADYAPLVTAGGGELIVVDDVSR